MPLRTDWVDGEFVNGAAMNAVGEAVNDVEAEAAGKAPATHTHSADDINTGTLEVARLPVGTTANTVTAGNDSRLSNTRTPTDNTVSTNKIQNAAVTAAKLNPDVESWIQSLIPASEPSVQVSDSLGTYTATLGSARHRFCITAQQPGATINVAAPVGIPNNGWQLVYRIKALAARSLSWNAAFRPIGVALPTTCTPNKTLYVACEYNATDAKWDVLAVAEEA